MALGEERKGWTHAEYVERTARRLACSQIAHECRLGLAAAQNLATALRPNDLDQSWLAIRGVLVCAANVGRILSPKPFVPRNATQEDKERAKALRERGRLLRTELGIEATSPLFQREVRDGMEHIDERLDGWFKKTGSFLDLFIGSPRRSPSDGVTVLRQYDPKTGQVRVLDRTTERYSVANLQKLVGALRELEPRADAGSYMPLRKQRANGG